MGLTKNDFNESKNTKEEFGVSTLLIHSDDILNGRTVNDVAPPINVSTTFRYSKNSDDWIPWRDQTQEQQNKLLNEDFVYSRLSHPNNIRLETNLNKVFKGYTTVYNSGLSTFNAIMTYVNPSQVFFEDCYHGIKSISRIWERNNSVKVYTKLDDIFDNLQEGDLVHLESPINPYGTVIDVAKYIDFAHSKKAFVVWDATFAPPPVLDPWKFDVDFVIHSLTKYFGGHSDLLAGALITRDSSINTVLKNDRIYLGTNIGNLEAYLLLRSLRTYEMRYKQQSANVADLVRWISENNDNYKRIGLKITHALLQKDTFVKDQLEGELTTPVFSLYLKDFETCKKFISNLNFFQHATSLGGVESLVELRCLTDPHIDLNLIRISVGCEDSKDLINDIKKSLENCLETI
ncbi:hypothetical protein QEN19_000678 [Hanseniaspora menglaensis]